MLWLFISLSFGIFVVVGELTVQPTNLIVVVGHQAVLSCSTQSDQSLSWHRRQIGHSLFSNAITSTAGQLHIVQAVDGVGRRRLDLVVESVTADDAGEYTCRGSGPSDDEFVLQVVVLGAVPNCTTDVLGDLDLTADGHLLMRCTILSWTTNINPEMPWFDPAGYEFVQTHLSAVIGQTPSDHGHPVARLEAADNSDDQTKLFNLSFAADRGEPGYVFNWSSADVVVLLSVRNVRIRANSLEDSSNCCSSTEENVLTVGRQLICEADGPPDMQYVWEDDLVLGTVAPLHYSHQRLDLLRPGKYKFRCTASHRTRGITYNATADVEVLVVAGVGHSTTQSASSDGGLSVTVYVVVVGLSVFIVIVVIVVVVLVVAFVVFYRRTKPPGRQTSDDSEGQPAAVQSNALRVVAAAEPTPEQSAPDTHRRFMPLPTIDESSIPQHAYEDPDPENQPETSEPAADDLPTIDVSPVTPGEEQSERDPDTTPKSIYQSLVTLELRSSETQVASKAPNEYIQILDVDPLSRDTSAIDLCY